MEIWKFSKSQKAGHSHNRLSDGKQRLRTTPAWAGKVTIGAQ